MAITGRGDPHAFGPQSLDVLDCVVHAALDFAQRAGDRVQILDAGFEPDHHVRANHSPSLGKPPAAQRINPETAGSRLPCWNWKVPQPRAFGD